MMIDAKHEETVRDLAFKDGVEAANQGLSKDACEWMPGTIFYDDWHDGYEQAQ